MNLRGAATGILVGATVFLAACSPETEVAQAPEPATQVAPPIGAKLDTSIDITAADLSARVKELADDKYEGRAPGTVAGEASAQWIADEMQRVGLAPAVGDSYFQPVEMVAQTVDEATSSLSFNINGVETPFAMRKDAVFVTKRQNESTVAYSDTDVVFVGYGVNAPEVGWNDYAGIDVKGKTVIILVNDPGFAINDESLFKGAAMTYYGRWTYKFEEASRQGAAGALIVHETVPASYGWDVVENSWTGEQADLVRGDGGADQSVLNGWITLDRAEELFTAAGLDFDAEKLAANTRGFTAKPMPGLKSSATINQTVERRQSRNVAGTIRGTYAPDEHVIFMAHWDHIGRNPTAMPGADGIYNGAVDNATGVSSILEIAEAMAAAPAPRRSITFIAVTLEESGLLGSAYFAENPFIPLQKIVAGVNIDAINPIGRTRDVIVVGAGASELEDRLKALLDPVGRVIRPDPEPEAGYFYRSDHVSLAKKGVPMLYLDGGIDALDGGEAKGKAASEAYRKLAYHGPSDEFRDSWDFSGMEEDMKVARDLAAGIANSADWPTWYLGNEFKAIRDASLAAP
ncbi:M28 family peptidase [bacterium]|nr:M28 family peptidase [bacterium]